MNEITICSSVMPVVSGCDHLAAAEPFYHADRVADFHVLIYVTKGTIYVTEEDTEYAVSEGELLFLKSGVRHFGAVEIPRGTEWYFVHFTCDAPQLREFAPDSEPLPQYSRMESTLVLPKYLTGLTGGSIARSIAQLCDYFCGDDRFRQWRINAMLFEVLSDIALRRFEQEKEPALSDRVCAYLSEHISQPFSAQDISRSLFLSYKRLAAVFKAQKGMTMQQYHNSLRMNEACRLLRSTLLPVGEIASELGFADMLYFSRCFRQYVGTSPTEYRRSKEY